MSVLRRSRTEMWLYLATLCLGRAIDCAAKDGDRDTVKRIASAVERI